MRHRLPVLTFAALVLAAAAPYAAAQQVYKWTDEKGVVNYSNSPPADKAKKGVTVVEDRVSVYSSDPAVVQATQNARARSGTAPPPQAPERPVGTVLGSPTPPPVAAVDPCLNGYDQAGCGYYDGVPVFAGRRRPPHLIQPNLPPGAIAGNVNQNSGYTPGLSTQADLGAQPPPVRRPVPQTARIRDIPPR